MTRFVNVDRQTPMLLPPDLRDWVQTDDLVHFIVDALAVLDLSSARLNPRGTGDRQYPPGMMLGLLIYCYARGAFSSRQIERETYQNLSVRYLSGDTHPDHDTIAKFRRENAPLIRSAFVQLLRLAQETGLLKLGAIALDGTKMGAAASKRRNLTYEQLQAQIGQLEERVNGLLEQAETADQAPNDGEEPPAPLADAKERRARLLAAKAQLEEQALKRRQQWEQDRQQLPPGCRRGPLPAQPKAEERINLTDKDSTLQRARAGYIQGYNAQWAMSVESGLIVGADVVVDGNDRRQLKPMIEQVIQNAGRPADVLVDTAYENIAPMSALEAQGIRVLCPPQPSGNAKKDGAEDKSPWRRASKAYRQQMRQRLEEPAGKALYRLRKITIEPGFGIVKSVLGFAGFSLRGLEKVKNEWQLMSLAFNCRRMVKHFA
jgi:transposase